MNSATANISANTSTIFAPTKSPEVVKKKYPDYKVIVLDDDFNTFEHVSSCLTLYIPNMSDDRAWELTNQVHFDGQALVWSGPFERAEMYHLQLRREGLTMAPLETS